MLGLGETRDELVAVLRDLRASGVDCLTLGQYLRPTLRHLPVERYVEPRGVRGAAATPRARSASATSRADRSCAAPSAPIRSSTYSPPAEVRS